MEKVKFLKRKPGYCTHPLERNFLLKGLQWKMDCRSICATEELEAVCIFVVAEAHT